MAYERTTGGGYVSNPLSTVNNTQKKKEQNNQSGGAASTTNTYIKSSAQQEAEWAAKKEEERRQERVAEQAHNNAAAQKAEQLAARKATNNPVNTTSTTTYDKGGTVTSVVNNPVNTTKSQSQIEAEEAAALAKKQEEIRARQAAEEAARIKAAQEKARQEAIARAEIAQRQAAANTALEQGSESVNTPVTTPSPVKETPRTTGMSPEQEAWLASQEGQAAYANQLAKEANDAYFTEQARRLPDAYQLQGLRGGRPPVISSNTDTQYVEDFNEAYRLALSQGSKGADASAFAFNVADTQREKRNGLSLNTGTATDEDDFYTAMYLPDLSDEEIATSGVNVNLNPFTEEYANNLITRLNNNRYDPTGALARYYEMNGTSSPTENILQKTYAQARDLQDRMRPDVDLPDVVSLYSSSKRGTYPYDRYGNVNTSITAPETTGTGSTFLNNPFINALSNIAETGLRQTLFGPFAGSLPVDLNTQLKAQNNFYKNAGGELGDILTGNLKELFGKNSGAPNNTKPQTSGNGASSGQPATMNELIEAINNDPELKKLYEENVARWVDSGWSLAEAGANALSNMAGQLGVSTGNPDFGKSVADVQAEAHAKAQEKNLKVGTQSYNDFIDNYVNDYYGSKSGNGSKGGGTASNTGNSSKANAQENIPNITTNGNGRVGVTGEESGNPVYNMGTQTSTGDIALESSIRRGDTTYQQVYDDYVTKHKDAIGEDDARRLAYQRIYDLGYRPDINDPKSYEHYTTGMSKDFIDALEKAGPNGGNNYYTNAGSYNDRYINMLAGGFDRSYDQERLFDDLTSELAGNAFANQYEWTGKDANDKKGKWIERANPLAEPYATTPGYSGDDKYPQNGAMQAALNGGLTTDQILHFYDANYSDLVIPPEAQRWMADDSTRALLQDVINNRQNLDRLQKEHGTKEELFEALRALLDANPGLKLLYDSGRLNMGDIANQFAKAPVDDTGAVDNPFAGNGGTSNSPHPGYYEWDGKLYPIDQEKAKYYLKNGTYKGWDEGMREYYNTFGTFYGYRPDWKTAGRNVSSGSSTKNYSGGSYSYTGGTRTSGGNGYYYNRNNTGSYGNTTNRATASPSTANQRQNRIYNIMKNWSF